MKRLSAFSIRIILFFLPLILILELLFRSFIPACSRPMDFVDPDTRLSFFQESGSKEGLFSYGRFCTPGGHWALNEHGYNSMYDYQYSRTQGIQRIALIGDSYILGLWIDQENHLEVFLDSLITGDAEVYSFGISGTFLLSNIEMAQYIDSLYDPDILVIFVNKYDVMNSIRDLIPPKYNNFQLISSTDGFRIIPPVIRQGLRNEVKKRALRILMVSGIFRYLVYHANLSPFRTREETVLNGAALSDQLLDDGSLNPEDTLAISATEWIIDLLAESTRGKTVLFVGDGPRHDGMTDDSPDRCPDCVLVQHACETINNFHFLDLEQIYIERFDEEGMLFSLNGTLHWNSYGNRVVAKAIHQALIEIGALDIN